MSKNLLGEEVAKRFFALWFMELCK